MTFQDIIRLMIESFPKLLIQGIKVTIPLTVISFSFALIIAVIVAMIQYAKVPVLSKLCRVYIWFIRGTPLLVQLYRIFFGLPSMGILIDGCTAAVFVFSLNEGAYCAETMRAALEAVPAGPVEAGWCVGMNYLQIMWHIVLPQAFRTAVPPLFNSLISMLKDTSLASNITVVEMFFSAQRITGRTYQFMPIYLEVALIYLMFSSILMLIQAYSEKRLNAYGGNRG